MVDRPEGRVGGMDCELRGVGKKSLILRDSEHAHSLILHRPSLPEQDSRCSSADLLCHPDAQMTMCHSLYSSQPQCVHVRNNVPATWQPRGGYKARVSLPAHS